MIKQLAIWILFGVSSIKSQCYQEVTFLKIVIFLMFILIGPLIIVPFVGETLIKIISKIRKWLERIPLLNQPVTVPMKKNKIKL